MVTLGLVAVAAVIAFGVLVRKWQGGVPSIILPALPIALLFLVLPIPPAIFNMIRGFQRISESGDTGIVAVAGHSVDIARPLFWGSIAFIVAMIAAAMLQWNAGREEPDIAEAAAEPTGLNQPSNLAEKVFLVGSSVLVLPAVGLIHLASGIPRLVMATAMRLDRPLGSTPPVASSDLANTSVLISSQLVGAMFGGISLSLLIVIAAAGSLIALRSRQPSRPLSVYSWLVLAVCLLLAAWNAIQLNADMRSFELARGGPAQ
ncbi:MAG TPA: hypothetical protein VH740_27725 [Vicinamibacterales bacterium]|jgi:hypothetical protein